MRIIKTEKINAVSGQEIVLGLCDNISGSTVTGEVDIQTSTNLPFTVTASVDGEHYTAQSVINMGVYDIVSSVTTAGHYMFPAAGLHSAKLTFSGDGQVIIKEVF